MDISNWEALKNDLGENTGKSLNQLLKIAEGRNTGAHHGTGDKVWL